MAEKGRKGRGTGAARRPTIRDVAAASGVSMALVSYAFNRPERVALVTRERILATAAAIGYYPDHAARALRLGRHGVVALMGASGVESVLADPASALVARGVTHACDRAGLGVLFAGSDGTAPVDGGILVRRSAPPDWSGPLVVVDPPEPTELPGVACLLREGVAAAARHLASLGHRRLAVLAWPGAGIRLEGARAGWADVGAFQALMAPGALRLDTLPTGHAVVRMSPRPTAVLALSDSLALEMLDAAAFAGLRVPQDISVMGVDDLPGSDLLGLSTVAVPYRAMGELAAGMLLSAIDGRPPVPAPPLPAELVVRRTTGPAP